MTLAEIIERLEKATGPDRELDALLHVAAFSRPHSGARPDVVDAGYVVLPDYENPERWGKVRAPEYTAYIDSAVALVERAQPGTEWQLTTLYHQPMATVGLNSNEDGCHAANATTPALALCLALLRALAAQQGQGQP